MAKNPFNRSSRIDVPIYDQVIYVAGNREKYREMMQWINADADEIDMIGGQSLQMQNKDGQTFIAIGVFEGDESVLVHECAHAAFQILSHVGVDPTERNNEAYCYLLGFIFREAKKRIAAK